MVGIPNPQVPFMPMRVSVRLLVLLPPQRGELSAIARRLEVLVAFLLVELIGYRGRWCPCCHVESGFGCIWTWLLGVPSAAYGGARRRFGGTSNS